MLNDTQIPSSRVAIVNDKEGPGPSRAWFRFFSSIYNFIGLGNGVVPETSGGTGQTTYAAGDMLYASAANTLARLAVAGVGNKALLGTDGTNMPQWIVVGYGQFIKTTTTSAAAATPLAVTFDSSTLSQNTSFVTSQISVTNGGIYNINISGQINNPGGGVDTAVIWVKANGTDIANTARHFTVNAARTVNFSFDIDYEFTAGQYFEVYYYTAGGNSELTTIASGAYPQAPAMIVTVNQVV